MSLQPMSPGPDPGACPRCGEWRKAGMIHRCPAASSDPPDDTWKRAGDDTPPEIERLRTAAHRRPDELIPVEEAEDAVWDVITRMNEEPAPCSGPAKRQARWLWERWIYAADLIEQRFGAKEGEDDDAVS